MENQRAALADQFCACSRRDPDPMTCRSRPASVARIGPGDQSMRPTNGRWLMAGALAFGVVYAGSALAQQVAFDDFSDPETGWTIIDDPTIQAGYVNGGYQMSATQRVGVIYATSDFVLGDGVITVEATDLPDSAFHFKGIFLRSSNRANLFGFMVAPDGTTLSFRLQAGELFQYQSTNLDPALYRNGEPNVLSVEAVGRRLEFSVNGEVLAEVDNASAIGFAGLIISPNDVFSGTFFDNWRVEQP